MDTDGNTHFNLCSHDVWIQHAAASRHVGDSLPEAIPGVYSVIVPLPSVVVVMVVVCETCAHANGATNAKAMLNTIFFMFSPLLVELRQ
jgi:hypothetical protein